MITLLCQILGRFIPAQPLRRYRVAPRQHPILFRRRLMQGIARELRKTGLAVSPNSVQYSDSAL